MKESTLIKICIAGSVLGIISLYFISLMIEPQEMSIGEITNNHAGMVLKLNGTVRDFRAHPSGHIFFELHGASGGIDVVIWEDRAEQLLLSGFNLSRIRDGVVIELIGSAELYRGRIQIVV